MAQQGATLPASQGDAGRDVGSALRRALTRTAATLAAAAALAMLAGAGLAFSGAATPFTGFKIFGAALPAAVVALVLGFVGLVLSRGDGADEDRARARNALVAGIAMVFAFVLLALPGRGLPRINDITTDPADPPGFVAAATDPANAGRDMTYPPDYAEQQRGGYPDLAPLIVAGTPAEVFPRVEATATKLGWKIVRASPSDGTLEANETSRVFHFVDDVVVRVRPDAADPTRSRVDVRSKSRDGRGDMGVNARRIAAFRAALAGD